MSGTGPGPAWATMGRMCPGSSYASVGQRLVLGPRSVRRPPRVRGAAHPGPRLLAAALVYLFAFVLTCGVFLWTRAGQWLDGALLPRAERGGGYEQRTALVGPAKTVLAVFGSPETLAALLGAVLLVGLLGRRPLAGLTGVGVVLCAAAVAGEVKSVLPRADYQIATSTTHNSFPSGHVTVAAALLLAFMLVLPAWARRWLAFPGVMGVSVIASATMIAGWHRFSDCLGGVLLSLVLFSLAAAGLASCRREPDPDDAVRAHDAPGSRNTLRTLVEVVVLLAVPFWALLLILSDLRVSVQRGAFVAIVTATGCTLLAVVSLVFLMRSVDFGPAGNPSTRSKLGIFGHGQRKTPAIRCDSVVKCPACS